MEIKTCKRCGEPWCFHGTGRPIRCGKCKTPYWDREAKVAAEGVKENAGVENRRSEVGSDKLRRVGGNSTLVKRSAKRTVPFRTGKEVNPVEQGVEPVFIQDAPTVKTCRGCEGDLRQMKGKWVCCKIGCGLEGQEQGRV